MTDPNESSSPALMAENDLQSREAPVLLRLVPDGGLTKREHFAAMAMMGLLANDSHAVHNEESHRSIARFALHNADALIAELNKEVSNG